QQVFGRCLLELDRGRADAEREQYMPAKPKCESERCRPDETVVAVRLKYVFGVRVRTRQHVTLKMHRTLRLARGAGGECDQADIVARRVAGGEVLVARL